LARGPLLRPVLVHFPGDHHRLYMAMHHLIFDGVSLYRVVLPELVAIYQGLAEGRPVPLDPPSATYADYARWQQEWITGDRARRRLAYWTARLAGAPRGALPADHPDPVEGTRGHGGLVPVAVDAARARCLEEVGRALGASLFQVLAATWAVLLACYSGEPDVVFATAADLRQRPEFQQLVGCCLTPLVLRPSLAGATTFGEVVSRVRDDVLDGMDHLVPFERIVRELPAGGAGADRGGADRGGAGRGGADRGGGNPVYPTMIVLEPPGGEPAPGWSLHQMDAAIGEAIGATHGPDLELELDQRPAGDISGRLIYDRAVFRTATARRVARHWQRVVAAVAAGGADLRLDDIVVAEPDEVRRQVVEWNATGAASEGGDVTGWLAAILALGRDDAVAVLESTDRRHPQLGTALARAVGARPVPVPPEDACDGARLGRLISGERVSVVAARPAVWRRLVATGLTGRRGLRVVSVGAPLDAVLASELLARVRVVWNAYAVAPTGACAAVGRVEDPAEVTVGRPLAGSRAYVLDRRGRPVPVGVWGELLVAGAAADWVDAGVAAGVDPFQGGPALPTGDRARWRPDGRLEVAAPLHGAPTTKASPFPAAPPAEQ
ncbi:MAG TPA: condensation domain-containing protein, partial [Acidimicrobiales bacterium]|nr:condensation domain-containing protein [Acidimicrobiales bacterium]